MATAMDRREVAIHWATVERVLQFWMPKAIIPERGGISVR